ncbi:WXG100 family type VII secretion target [Actinoplanes sp. CA-131856]
MAKVAQTFEETTNHFNNDLKSVNDLMLVLQTTWTGDASKNFNSAMDSWEQSFKNVIQELIHMLEAMGVSSKSYQDAEDAAAAAAQNFSTALPI